MTCTVYTGCTAYSGDSADIARTVCTVRADSELGFPTCPRSPRKKVGPAWNTLPEKGVALVLLKKALRQPGATDLDAKPVIMTSGGKTPSRRIATWWLNGLLPKRRETCQRNECGTQEHQGNSCHLMDRAAAPPTSRARIHSKWLSSTDRRRHPGVAAGCSG